MLGTTFLVIALGVFFRYVMNMPIAWVEELSRFLLAWIGMLAAAYAFAHSRHTAVDILFDRLSSRAQALLRVFQSVVFQIVFLLMLANSLQGFDRYVMANYLPINEGVVYTIVPLFFFLLSIHNIFFLAGHAKALRHAFTQSSSHQRAR